MQGSVRTISAVVVLIEYIVFIMYLYEGLGPQRVTVGIILQLISIKLQCHGNASLVRYVLTAILIPLRI